jgi:ABC-type dipeptide/oligopeptide/nickel transport system permease component
MTVVLLLLRRALTAIPILLTVSILLFVALRLLPVDPAAMSMPPNATIEDIETKRREMGLDKPLPTQYAMCCTVTSAGRSSCAATPHNWSRHRCLPPSSSPSSR